MPIHSKYTTQKQNALDQLFTPDIWIAYQAANAPSRTAISPPRTLNPPTAPITAPLEGTALGPVSLPASLPAPVEVAVGAALFEAALVLDAALLDARMEDDEAESVDIAAELLEAAALSVEELAAALVSAAEALLAAADEANSELCFGTVLVDSSTKNGV